MRIPKWQVFKIGGCFSYLVSIMVFMTAVLSLMFLKDTICGNDYSLEFDKYQKALKLEQFKEVDKARFEIKDLKVSE